MKIRKALFVLPNLFTISSVFCAVYSIAMGMGAMGDVPEDLALRNAALAIIFSILFDMCDGRVARLTKTQSEFGLQLDSLADVIAFGVAPAMLVYRWSLHVFPRVGIVAAFVFTACAAIRLARFNVLATKKASPDFFIGLPTPLAAGAIVALILTHGSAGGGEVVHKTSVLAFVLVLAYLMVSNVRYRTFKRLPPKRMALLLATTGVVFGAVRLVGLPAVFALMTMIAGYLVAGLLEELVRFPKDRGMRIALALRKRRGRTEQVEVPTPDVTDESNGGSRRDDG